MRIDHFMRLATSPYLLVDVNLNRICISKYDLDLDIIQVYADNGLLICVVANRRLIAKDLRNSYMLANVANMVSSQDNFFILNRYGIREYKRYSLLSKIDMSYEIRSIGVIRDTQYEYVEVCI